VNLDGANPTSQLLVCTGAGGSSGITLPDKAVITNIRVLIKGEYDTLTGGSAEIFEIWPWDGTADAVPPTSRNQAGTYSLSDDTGVLSLPSSNTQLEPRGTNNWKWWWRSRLLDGANGVAIRARRTSGSVQVKIDHVALEVTYTLLHQPLRVRPVDYRMISYENLAGISTSSSQNENGELYLPTTRSTNAWHDEPEDWIEWFIQTRATPGIKRLVFGVPAGKIEFQDFSSHQWEPLFDQQRAALMKRIPEWLAADPEREAILYLGTRILDPAYVRMADETSLDVAHDPDVSNPDDVRKLERTYFPYRDCVGIKRFLLDASSVIDRTKARALFAWGRDNGMEFVMEAIPFTNSSPPYILDETITEVYGAYALAGFIIGDDFPPPGRTARDPDMKWHFTKGRLIARVDSNDYTSGFDTEAENRRFFQRFAREGYALMPRDFDGNLDDAARIVTGEHIGRGATRPAARSATRGAVQSVTRAGSGSGLAS
jgi:hypothetical protein